MMRVAFACVCDDRMRPGLEVLLYSLRMHCTEAYDFHVICEPGFDCEGLGVTPLHVDRSRYAGIAKWFTWGEECYWKWEAFDLLGRYDRVIVIDADMLCQASPALLFDEKLNAWDFLACRDVWRSELGLTQNARKINSGLVVYNRSFIERHPKVREELSEVARGMPAGQMFEGDQTIIWKWHNQHATRWRELPIRYNCMKIAWHRPELWEQIALEPVFIHYVMLKPWSEPSYTLQAQRKARGKKKTCCVRPIAKTPKPLYDLWFEWWRKYRAAQGEAVKPVYEPPVAVDGGPVLTEPVAP